VEALGALSFRRHGARFGRLQCGRSAWNHFRTTTPAAGLIAGRDGIAGISDDQQLLCFSVRSGTEDPILKERLFGLTGPEGITARCEGALLLSRRHATNSYLKMLYKYPQAAFTIR